MISNFRRGEHLTTLKIEFQESICNIQFDRPEAKNAITAEVVADFNAALDACEKSVTVIILTGSSEVFCSGLDFGEIGQKKKDDRENSNSGALYDLWLRLTTGPYVVISHVKGKTNAGGLGFVAASDIVLADDNATFGLSELLFGVFPACVLPFLIRRIGFQKSNYLTLMTQPFSADYAHTIGLVDARSPQSDLLLQKHLLRLRPLTKRAIMNYKMYAHRLHDFVSTVRPLAISANVEIFSDPTNIDRIINYRDNGIFPWESSQCTSQY